MNSLKAVSSTGGCCADGAGGKLWSPSHINCNLRIPNFTQTGPKDYYSIEPLVQTKHKLSRCWVAFPLKSSLVIEANFISDGHDGVPHQVLCSREFRIRALELKKGFGKLFLCGGWFGSDKKPFEPLKISRGFLLLYNCCGIDCDGIGTDDMHEQDLNLETTEVIISYELV
ncbi:O-succinylhomoserine (Thiol)-lyase [Striga asiatica]|uniref:O-succinylhomoserine (Thiol)-lyase n=1 Tax=Striga asiatica TaxID=4170 RepID=A0A5A7R2E6_STRAF|nr:O-succinylhomoserine (Thiol)-lyase [Striga asiatica]